MKQGAICLGAQVKNDDDKVSMNTRPPNEGTNHRRQRGINQCGETNNATKAEKEAVKKATAQGRHLKVARKTQTIFQLPPPAETKKTKMPRYHWHLVMNHATPETLTKSARNSKLRIPELEGIKTTHQDLTCRGCYEGKMVRAAHRRKTHDFKIGEAVSSDILGPINIPGIPQHFKRYFLSFIDAASRYAYVQPLAKRSETTDVIKTFLDKLQAHTGATPTWMISDNAGEYLAGAVTNMLGEREIEHRPIVTYNSEEIWVAERFNRSIMSTVRAALSTAGMRWEYWTWALLDATDK